MLNCSSPHSLNDAASAACIVHVLQTCKLSERLRLPRSNLQAGSGLKQAEASLSSGARVLFVPNRAERLRFDLALPNLHSWGGVDSGWGRWRAAARRTRLDDPGVPGTKQQRASVTLAHLVVVRIKRQTHVGVDIWTMDLHRSCEVLPQRWSFGRTRVPSVASRRSASPGRR